MKKISLIVAMSDNLVIGENNTLIWHLPNDLKYFKATTMGKPIVMGRKTYESIGRPLPGRENFILTSQRNLTIPGCTVVHSVDEVLAKTKGVPEVVIAGGGQIYRLFLPFVSKMYVTYVHTELEGKTTFPAIDLGEWKEVSREKHTKDEKHAFDYSFVVFERLM